MYVSTDVPTHAGIMTIVADAHSVQKIVDWFSLMNNCPYLISQLDSKLHVCMFVMMLKSLLNLVYLMLESFSRLCLFVRC